MYNLSISTLICIKIKNKRRWWVTLLMIKIKLFFVCFKEKNIYSNRYKKRGSVINKRATLPIMSKYFRKYKANLQKGSQWTLDWLIEAFILFDKIWNIIHFVYLFKFFDSTILYKSILIPSWYLIMKVKIKFQSPLWYYLFHSSCLSSPVAYSHFFFWLL